MDDLHRASSHSNEGQSNHREIRGTGLQTAEVLRWAVSQLVAARPWDNNARAVSDGVLPVSAGALPVSDVAGRVPDSAPHAPDVAGEVAYGVLPVSDVADLPAQVGSPMPPNPSNWEDEQIARSEAQWILEWAADWTRSNLLVRLHDAVPDEALEKFQAALSRRLAGEPLQYIIGVAPFYGRDFVVRPGCLIPRPETEILADEATRFAKKDLKSGCILDIGTGSGALAITLKLECPTLDVCAIDVSREALSIARENADKLSADLTFLEVDAFQWLGLPFGLPSPVRMIVSNPPYIPKQDVEELSVDVREHEPRLALDGGADGLDFYRLFAERAFRCFSPGKAAIFLEVGVGQGDDVLALFERDEWAEWKFDVVPDLRGIPRVVRGIRE